MCGDRGIWKLSAFLLNFSTNLKLLKKKIKFIKKGEEETAHRQVDQSAEPT